MVVGSGKYHWGTDLDFPKNLETKPVAEMNIQKKEIRSRVLLKPLNRSFYGIKSGEDLRLGPELAKQGGQAFGGREFVFNDKDVHCNGILFTWWNKLL